MVNKQPGKWVVPNPQLPRSFGLMHIVFGSLLLLIGVGYGLYYHYVPTIAKNLQAQAKEVQDKVKADHDAKVAELKKQEAAAKTKEEKAALQAERVVLEDAGGTIRTPTIDLSNMNVMSDRRLLAYYITEVSTGIVLNLLMIISGAALLALTEWGRRLGIWVAALKILRWFAMTAATMVLVLPVSMELSQKALAATEAQMQAQGQRAAMPMPMSELFRMIAIFGAVFMVFSAIVASIYPAMSIWYLTRAAARAACMKQPEPQTPEPGP
jgi:hypothetical protein